MTTSGLIFRIAIVALAVLLALSAPAADSPFKRADPDPQQRHVKASPGR